MPFVALVSRALAMIGLFYFPEYPIACVQHSSCDSSPKLALMWKSVKIDVSLKQHQGRIGAGSMQGAAGRVRVS